MSLLTEALQEIDSWMQTSRSTHAEWIRSYGIRPGLDRDLIELYSEEIDFRFSDEVYELYQWHDGIIKVGDYANPIFFLNLEQTDVWLVRPCSPHPAYLPLFKGHNAYWMIYEASDNQKESSIFMFDGCIECSDHSARSLPGHSPGKPGHEEFCPNTYAPSITSLMQAMAECARTYDGISAELIDGSLQDLYISHNRSILSPIYEKYGVVGDSSGIWR
jgi:hypothetical protein